MGDEAFGEYGRNNEPVVDQEAVRIDIGILLPLYPISLFLYLNLPTLSLEAQHWTNFDLFVMSWE